MTGFPSYSDRDYLRDKVKLATGPGYKALSDDEKRRHHAYDYAFRAATLGQRAQWRDGRLANPSPIDPDGRWFDAGMAAEAERFFANSLTGFLTPGRAIEREAAA